MAPLPKRRHSTARSGKRKLGLSRAGRGNVLLANCPNCGQKKRPHFVCPSCGQYNGQIVVTQKSRKKADEKVK